jgi:hypothetical protein
MARTRSAANNANAQPAVTTVAPAATTKRGKRTAPSVDEVQQEEEQPATTKRSTRRRTIDEPIIEAPVVEDIEVGTTGAEEVEDEEEEEVAVDTFGVDKMTMKELKEQLKERCLSINGTQKVLAKRLLDRLIKEQDPEYKPKPQGRTCKWCQAPMKKRRTRKGDQFYGCSAFPHCQYTTSLSGYAKPRREHLKGKYATFYNPNFDYERYY